jgi:hypothetical protein
VGRGLSWHGWRLGPKALVYSAFFVRYTTHTTTSYPNYCLSIISHRQWPARSQHHPCLAISLIPPLGVLSRSLSSAEPAKKLHSFAVSQRRHQLHRWIPLSRLQSSFCHRRQHTLCWHRRRGCRSQGLGFVCRRRSRQRSSKLPSVL